MKHPFHWLHGFLAVIAICVCALLLTAQTGHPPGVVFLPLVVAAWVVTHVFLGLLQLLAARGRARRARSGEEPGSWPILLLIIVAVLGFTVLYMFAGFIAWYLSNHAWSIRRLIYLALPFVALACLSGILLRMHWGRLMAAAICLLMAAYLLFKAVLLAFFGGGLGVGMLLYAILLVGGLGYLGYHLLTSPRIRSFFLHG